MNEKTVDQSDPNVPADQTSAEVAGAEVDVEGHYMNGFAAEQEAAMRQRQLVRGPKSSHEAPDTAGEHGIVDRIRHRLGQ